MLLKVGMAVRTLSSAVVAPDAYIAVDACVAVIVVTPTPLMVTAPVDEFTDATAVLLEAHVKTPLLVDVGAVRVKPAPRKRRSVNVYVPYVGACFETVMEVADDVAAV
jgi:hypothetical protein